MMRDEDEDAIANAIAIEQRGRRPRRRGVAPTRKRTRARWSSTGRTAGRRGAAPKIAPAPSAERTDEEPTLTLADFLDGL
jgi:hypothetical protein